MLQALYSSIQVEVGYSRQVGRLELTVQCSTRHMYLNMEGAMARTKEHELFSVGGMPRPDDG